MTISYAWLRQYIKTDRSPQEIASILTSIGLEVESVVKVEAVKGGLHGVVVGHVLTCQKHPDADRLSVTTVDIGEGDPLQIVCGAPNVAAGQKVPVATIGTTLHMGEKSITLVKTKIRGQFSMGMICAEDELGLGTSHDGIMVLDPSTRVGTPAREYFGLEDDYVFEIGLTPNRIDGASHYGVARDLAAYINQTEPTKASLPSLDGFRVDNTSSPVRVSVENPEACPRYSGVCLSNIKVGPSPEWLQKRLRTIGMNPINNVVDITNFVLHEVGQPLHAFDADRIGGNRVIVRTLPEGSPFTTLDGVERKTSASDLMICDANEGMCIAGVFGGLTTGVTEGTKNIFLESACFNPIWVRKTARRHGLKTDSSFRFERGSDPNITVWALKRAAMLIKEIAGGEISSDVVDFYPNPIPHHSIELSLNHLNQLIGKAIPADRVKSILESLDIKIVAQAGSTLSLAVPPYRVDVTRPADVVEEVLRIYGYNNVEVGTRVSSTLNHTDRPDTHRLIGLVSESLSGNGFHEIMCNSLTKKGYYSNLTTLPEAKTAEIINPLSSDLNGMRQTLLFGGLEAVLHNSNHRNPNLKLFEWGNCYSLVGADKNSLTSYSESLKLGMWITGTSCPESWERKSEDVSVYHIKAFVNSLLERLGITPDVVESAEAPSDIFAYGIKLSIGNKELGYYGLVSGKILQMIGIKAEVFFAEIDWQLAFGSARTKSVRFSEIPKYPEVRRDLALLIDSHIKYEQLKELALKTEPKLLKAINLFDVYQGPKLGEGKKSYAMSFTLQDMEKTLTDKQIDKTMQSLMDAFASKLGAQVR